MFHATHKIMSEIFGMSSLKSLTNLKMRTFKKGTQLVRNRNTSIELLLRDFYAMRARKFLLPYQLLTVSNIRFHTMYNKNKYDHVSFQIKFAQDLS